MEFELTVTVTRHGHDFANGEKLSHGFATTHPDVDAVIEQDAETGVMSATFWYDAADFREAAERGAAIFTDAANASGLEPSDFIDARVSVVRTACEDKDARELQPA